MGVRNIKGLGSKKPISALIYIPPTFSPIYKIEVYDGTTTTDITDYVIEGEYTDGITETIGNFSFKVDNSTQAYSTTFNLYNQIRIYMDYGATATTMVFVGMIERLSKSNSNLIISGRGAAAKVIGKNITYAATNKARATILSEIIAANFDGIITTTNLEADTDTLTVNYYEKPFWEIVEEICSIGSRDAYIDKDFDFNYFVSGSRRNTTEAIVHGYNLINTGDFSPDASTISNSVRVYGSEVSGLPLISTSSDSTSQDTYDIKNLKISDESITTASQAKSKSDYELARNKDPTIVGTVISLGLPTLLPGEKLRISDPLNELTPDYYQVNKFTHKFSNDDPFMTEVIIKKERTSIPNILRNRIKVESNLMKSINKNDLDFSYIWDFNTNTGTHSSTTIEINPNTGNGVLKTTGGATGTWESDLLELDSNVSAVELRMAGQNTAGTQLFVSVDGGTVFNTVLSGDTTISTGKDIKIKVVINSATTEINAVALLYTL